jgi:hypothetical protein
MSAIYSGRWFTLYLEDLHRCSRHYEQFICEKVGRITVKYDQELTDF